MLERAQRHAAKYILNNYSDMSYVKRCIKTFYFTTLFLPRDIDLVLFYKYLHNYVDFEFSSYFELVRFSHSLRSSNNSTLLKLPRIKTTAPQVSYFYRFVRLWNSLPRHISEARSVFSFKKHVNDLYFSTVFSFNINEHRTWSLVCTCGFYHS